MRSVPKRRSGSQRIGVLADLESLEDAAVSRFDGHLSPIAMLEHVAGGRPMPRAVAYAEASQRGKSEALRGAGFDTLVGESNRTRRLLQLAMDAVAMAPRVDSVVIATADPCLLPIAEHLRSQGLRVELATFDADTFDEADSRFFILDLGTESIFTP